MFFMDTYNITSILIQHAYFYVAELCRSVWQRISRNVSNLKFYYHYKNLLLDIILT
jgi:hypothetical protein